MKENLLKKLGNIRLYNPLIDGPLAAIENELNTVLESFKSTYDSRINYKLKELYEDKDDFYYDNFVYINSKDTTQALIFLPLFISIGVGALIYAGIGAMLQYCKNHIKINKI